jgi:hypothetical protein
MDAADNKFRGWPRQYRRPESLDLPLEKKQWLPFMKQVDLRPGRLKATMVPSMPAKEFLSADRLSRLRASNAQHEGMPFKVEDVKKTAAVSASLVGRGHKGFRFHDYVPVCLNRPTEPPLIMIPLTPH